MRELGGRFFASVCPVVARLYRDYSGLANEAGVLVCELLQGGTKNEDLQYGLVAFS
jgi:hypothetical protein